MRVSHIQDNAAGGADISVETLTKWMAVDWAVTAQRPAVQTTTAPNERMNFKNVMQSPLIDIGVDTDGKMRCGLIYDSGSTLRAQVFKEGLASSIINGTDVGFGSFEGTALLNSKKNPRQVIVAESGDEIHNVLFPENGTGAPTVHSSSGLNAATGSVLSFIPRRMHMAWVDEDETHFVVFNGNVGVAMLMQLVAGVPTYVDHVVAASYNSNVDHYDVVVTDDGTMMRVFGWLRTTRLLYAGRFNVDIGTGTITIDAENTKSTFANTYRLQSAAIHLDGPYFHLLGRDSGNDFRSGVFSFSGASIQEHTTSDMTSPSTTNWLSPGLIFTGDDGGYYPFDVMKPDLGGALALYHSPEQDLRLVIKHPRVPVPVSSGKLYDTSENVPDKSAIAMCRDANYQKAFVWIYGTSSSTDTLVFLDVTGL